jgi:hypothetical protein
MGLDVYLGYGKGRRGVQEDSKKYPNHYFKIGYFRSSYNDWGLNRVLRKTIDKDLYYIFEPKDRYDFTPKWEKCREKCVEVLNEFKEFIEKLGNVSVMCISPPMYSISDYKPPENEKEATTIFLKNRDSKSEYLFKSYSNIEGSFYLDGIKCFAFINGKDYSKNNCVYVVYEPELSDKNENSEKALYKEYIEALEIVLETIDYVLDFPEPERKKYKLHWSA